jgi:hypothetical protein
MHYYLYEIKNTVNGKIYVGVHKTKSLDDGYMGSGKVVTNAIRKYGIEHFTKTILETFDNPADMFARENEVVNDEFLARPDVYNLRRGGTGGFDYINATVDMFSRNKKCSDKRTAKIQFNEEFRNKVTETLNNNRDNAKMADGRRKRLAETGQAYGSWNLGSKRTSDTKTKMSVSATGAMNSQYGTMWITNEINSMKINKVAPIPEGWRKGRVVK